jgi:hypothetical protein
MTQLQIDILEIFAEAQRRASKGDRWLYAMPHVPRRRGGALKLFGVRVFSISDRATEKLNFVAKRRIKTLARYKQMLQEGHRPRGLNIKTWQQAAAAIGLTLEVTRPAGAG